MCVCASICMQAGVRTCVLSWFPGKRLMDPGQPTSHTASERTHRVWVNVWTQWHTLNTLIQSWSPVWWLVFHNNPLTGRPLMHSQVSATFKSTYIIMQRLHRVFCILHLFLTATDEEIKAHFSYFMITYVDCFATALSVQDKSAHSRA